MATAQQVAGTLWRVTHDDGTEEDVAVPAGGGEAEALAAVAAREAGPAAPLLLAGAKARALEAVRVALDAKARAITAASAGADYAAVEKTSFAQQEEAARAYAAAGDGAAPEHLAMLDGLRALSARTRQQQADKILTKAGAFRAATAAMIALREQADDAIDAATDTAGVATALASLRTALASI